MNKDHFINEQRSFYHGIRASQDSHPKDPMLELNFSMAETSSFPTSIVLLPNFSLPFPLNYLLLSLITTIFFYGKHSCFNICMAIICLDSLMDQSLPLPCLMKILHKFLHLTQFGNKRSSIDEPTYFIPIQRNYSSSFGSYYI